MEIHQTISQNALDKYSGTLLNLSPFPTRTPAIPPLRALCTLWGGWAVWMTPGECVTFWYPHSIQPAWEAQGLTNTRESTRSWWASWKKSQQYHTPGHEMLNQLRYSTVSVSTPHCMQPFIGCSVISLTTAFIKYCSVFCSGQFGPSAACMTHEFSSSSKTDRIQSVEEIK